MSQVVSFMITSLAISVMARLLMRVPIVAGTDLTALTIRGCLVFLSLSLLAFPVRTMLGGAEMRDRVFRPMVRRY